MDSPEAIPEDVVRPRDEPHVLTVQLGSTQHSFEMVSKQAAMELTERAKTQDWVEIQNDRTYLLVPGTRFGTAFLVMSKADVLKIQLEHQQRQIEQQRMAAQRAIASSTGQRLVLP